MEDNCHPNLSSQPGHQLFTAVGISPKSTPFSPSFTKTAVILPNSIPEGARCFPAHHCN